MRQRIQLNGRAQSPFACRLRCTLVLLLGALLLPSGCKKFNTSAAEKTTDNVLGATDSPNSPPPALAPAAVSETCMPGSVQCASNVLQVCDASESWIPRQLCPTAALCSTDGCLKASCQEGELACNNGVLQGCNEAQTGWDALRDCGGAAYCNATEMTCTETPCTPGDYQCSGSELQSCAPDGSGWNTEKSCKSGALCDAEAGACDDSICQPADTICVGPQFQQCNQAQDGFEVVSTCASEALCSQTQGCLPIVCEPNEYICAENLLSTCLPDQSGYEVLDTCATPSHCNATAQLCADVPCQPGEYQCSGATLKECNSDRTAWLDVTTCDSASLCVSAPPKGQAVGCNEPTCGPGSFRCNGLDLEKCADGLTKWEALGPCATQQLCAQSAAAGLGSCRVPACDDGQHRCQDNGAQLEVCSVGRDTYEVKDTCALNQCDADRGVCAPCQEGMWRCNDSKLETCDATNGWLFDAQCDTAALCLADEQRCAEAVCEPDDLRCSDGDLQACNAARTLFQTIRNCGDTETCDATFGECDTCVPGDAYCEGDTRLVCDSNGQDYLSQECGEGRCSAEGCIICDEGSFSCNDDGILVECNIGGRGFTQKADCGFIGSCQTDQQRCCSPNANLGCTADASAVTLCSTNGLAQITDACDLSSLDACESGACVGCDPASEDAQCNGAGTHVQTCATGEFTDTMQCAFGCINAGQGQANCAPECQAGVVTQCSADGEGQQLCDDKGEWGATVSCEFGCLDSTSECAAQCRPTTIRCAPQGEQPQTCSAQGLWAATGESCDNVCNEGQCVACLVNSECLNVDAPRCDGASGCGPCQTANDCSHLTGYNACLSGSCTHCSENAHCSDGKRCNSLTGECVSCVDNSDCDSESAPICTDMGQCQACLSDADCGTRVCDGASDSPTLGQCLGCISDPDCSSLGNNKDYCGSNGTCFECDGSSGCDESKVCSGSGVCVECSSNAQCTDPNAASCDLAENTCAECQKNSDCSHITDAQTCASGQCVSCADDADCSDGNLCNGAEACSGGLCVGAPEALDCDDDNPCTTDTCDTTGCKNLVVETGTSCDDDNNVCNGAPTCDGFTCEASAGLTCDDDNECTTDTCNPISGCARVDVMDGSLCDDGDPCNGVDQCSTGTCIAGIADCNDNDPCTADSCTATGCTNTPVAEGTGCDDLSSCTKDDTCTAGVCGGTFDCDDGNSCTTDTCNEEAQTCINAAQADTCNESGSGVLTCADTGWSDGEDCAATSQVCFAGSCCSGRTSTACTRRECENDATGLDNGCGGTYDCDSCPVSSSR